MTKILIASSNPGKIKEIVSSLNSKLFSLVTPLDIQLDPGFDVAETGSTFYQNALIKAQAYASKTQLPALADDSGLLVDALDGQPGVYSKRFGSSDIKRCQKILIKLQSIPPAKRTAHFTSVVAFFDPATQTTLSAKGQVTGHIAKEARGESGFGYDPIFIPSEIPGDQTFAQLGPGIKNQISHRARALSKLKPKLEQYFS